MATYTGKDAIIEAGGVTVGKVKTITLDGEIEVQEDEYLGEDGYDYALGSKKYTASITYHQDLDDAGQNAMALGSEVNITIYPRGNVSGMQQIDFTAYVTTDPMTLEKNTKVEKALTLKVKGAPVKTTI